MADEKQAELDAIKRQIEEAKRKADEELKRLELLTQQAQTLMREVDGNVDLFVPTKNNQLIVKRSLFSTSDSPFNISFNMSFLFKITRLNRWSGKQGRPTTN